MRGRTLLPAITGWATALAVACGTTDPDTVGSMEAVINGTPWQAERTFCFFRSDTRELTVRGGRTTGPDTRRSIELVELPNVPATVTLTADGPRALIKDTDAAGWDTHVGYATTEELTGTASIIEFDPARGRCRGTFSFVAVAVYVARGPVVVDTLHVTAGSWDGEVSTSF